MKRGFILLILSLISISFYGQNSILPNYEIVHNDTSISRIELSRNVIKTIYSADSGFRIIDVKQNRKQGLIILLRKEEKKANPQIKITNKIIQIKSLDTSKYSILYRYECFDDMSVSVINGIDISPTGDYMVLETTGYEWFGIDFFDFKKLGILPHSQDLNYKYFIKWLPYNSVLVAFENYTYFWGFWDKLTLINFNLENGLFKTWDFEKTHFINLISLYKNGPEFLACQLNNEINGEFKFIPLQDYDLREIQDTSVFIYLNDTLKFSVSKFNVSNKTINCFMSNLETNKVYFDTSYVISYYPFDRFSNLKMQFDSMKNSINIIFDAEIQYKNYSRFYGRIFYHLDLSGNIIQKEFNNYKEYKSGFDLIESYYDIEKNSFVFYKNGQKESESTGEPLEEKIKREIK